MKINDILYCFNHSIKNNENNKHYIGHSYIEKNIGSIKTAYTVISEYDPINNEKEIIHTKYTNAVPKEMEDVLIEESQKMALIEFIKGWNNDTGFSR